VRLRLWPRSVLRHIQPHDGGDRLVSLDGPRGAAAPPYHRAAPRVRSRAAADCGECCARLPLRQVIRHEQYDERCDIYSWAILACEVMTYQLPFDGQTPLEAAMGVARNGLRPALPDDCAAWLAELVQQAWHQQPQQRPSFSEICKRLGVESGGSFKLGRANGRDERPKVAVFPGQLPVRDEPRAETSGHESSLLTSLVSRLRLGRDEARARRRNSTKLTSLAL
jgi:hypothetical protein